MIDINRDLTQYLYIKGSLIVLLLAFSLQHFKKYKDPI